MTFTSSTYFFIMFQVKNTRKIFSKAMILIEAEKYLKKLKELFSYVFNTKEA